MRFGARSQETPAPENWQYSWPIENSILNDRHTAVTTHAWHIQTLIYGRNRMRPLTIEAAMDKIIVPKGVLHAG
jgi:hypothetical protein